MLAVGGGEGGGGTLLQAVSQHHELSDMGDDGTASYSCSQCHSHGEDGRYCDCMRTAWVANANPAPVFTFTSVPSINLYYLCN
jgi:hypothetical protein